MKYSEQLVWQAVYEFVPSFEKVKENSIDINLPKALTIAAVEAFLEIGNNGISCLGINRSYAAHIIQDALKELNSVGWMTFGTNTQYWQ